VAGDHHGFTPFHVVEQLEQPGFRFGRLNGLHEIDQSF